MTDEKDKVSVCDVTINCPGIPIFQSVQLLPAAPVKHLEKLIKGKLRALFAANNLEANESAFNVQVRENSRKVVDPMFELVRFCIHCNLTAADVGVGNDGFVHCGRCGKPTTFRLQDPE